MPWALHVALWILAVALPIGGFAAVLPRSERRHGKLRIVAGTFALGMLAFIPAEIVERVLGAWTGIERYSRPNDGTTLLFTFIVAAPLEQGLKVAAVAPVWRSRHFHEPIDGIVYASAAALGFATAHTALYLASRATGLDLVRALIAAPAHLFLAATWGYALGRDRHKRLGGRQFNLAWILSVAVSGVYDTIVFGRRSGTALVAALPLLFCMGSIAYLASRDLLRRSTPPASIGRTSRFLPIAPPSLRVMREALRRTERPVMLTWIAFGALVTTGVMTAMLAGAVALGHKVGVDFAAVDRGEAGAATAAPLLLLGTAALASFPFAGYLVARASSTRTVLEPAMSAGLAIAGSLVVLGLAAPVAVVFAIAFAPIAFALACAGAWLGLAR